MSALTAPFPYPGGKRRFASIVWRKLGVVDTYLEPFAGSCAVLLSNPKPPQREIISDVDGLLCNFWRAIRANPLEVAWYADWPTIHQDLASRHKWLVKWGRDNADRLSDEPDDKWLEEWIQHESPQLMDDPSYYDCKVAGWWVWGISNWIGGGWCQASQPGDTRPSMPPHKVGGGTGVAAQRVDIPVTDGIPNISNHRIGSGGQGVQAQKPKVPEGIPYIGCKEKTGGSRGVRPYSAEMPLNGMPNGERLLGWFNQLAARLSKVVVLNRPWTSFIGDSLLMQCKGSPKGIKVGVLLDPPYRTAERSIGLYVSDRHGTSDAAAIDSYNWAVEHGERYRICYFMHEGDFPTPDGWTAETMSFGGIRREDRRHRKDCALFSPACIQEDQLELF